MNFLEDLKAVIFGYYDNILELLPRLVLGVLVFIILYAFASRTRKAFNNRLTKTMDDPLLANFLAQIYKVTLVIFAILMFLSIVGLGKAAGGLLAGAGVSAFIIGFAFKDIGENFLAGIIMAFDRPFRIGDTVELGGKTGKIIGLTLRDTHMKTFDGKDVYIPNGMIVRNPIVNLTIDGFLRNDFSVRLADDTDIDLVLAKVRSELAEIEGVLQEDRAPNIFISEYTPSGMTLTVQYWFNTNDPSISGLMLKTETIKRTIKRLSEEGVYLPGDVREVKITQQIADNTKKIAAGAA